MRRVFKFLCFLLFWASWPAFYIYFKNSKRTRIILVKDGKVLVIQNWLSDYRWSLPGGGLHKGEDVIIGALRELLEETGIELKPGELHDLGSDNSLSHGLGYEFYCFSANLDHDVSVRKQIIEVAEVDWIDPKLLNNKNSWPDVVLSLDKLRDSDQAFLIQ
jgi:8-oxo-dGTP pyrophosphatase MutT (NUDIX family)